MSIWTKVLVSRITLGSTDQSTKNWINRGWAGSQSSWTRWATASGTFLVYLVVNSFNAVLVSSRWGQSLRMWARSSCVCWSEQLLRRQLPALFWDQWLQRSSVRYLPDSIVACTLVLITSYGDEPAVSHSGWGLFRDMNCGLKYSSDWRHEASSRSLASQKESTDFVTKDLKASLLRGSWRSVTGCGRKYCKQISLICENQDLIEGLALTRASRACLCRRLPCSLVIIPNKLKSLRCRRAIPGREPARK